MSLRFVVDGYNIINNPEFARISRPDSNPQPVLCDLIAARQLAGSPKNEVIVVFDGFPAPMRQGRDPGIKVIFSGERSADDKIKQIVEQAENPKNIVVVSDDSQIRHAARASGARTLSVAEFIAPKKGIKPGGHDKHGDKEMPGYVQQQQIETELRKLWLKEEE